MVVSRGVWGVGGGIEGVVPGGGGSKMFYSDLHSLLYMHTLFVYSIYYRDLALLHDGIIHLPYS